MRNQDRQFLAGRPRKPGYVYLLSGKASISRIRWILGTNQHLLLQNITKIIKWNRFIIISLRHLLPMHHYHNIKLKDKSYFCHRRKTACGVWRNQSTRFYYINNTQKLYEFGNGTRTNEYSLMNLSKSRW